MAKIFPLELTKPTDELKKMIEQYPDYPIVVLVGEDAAVPEYRRTYCSSIQFEVAEILDCETPYDNDCIVCNDRNEFNENFKEWLWDELGGNDNPPKITEEEFQEALKQERARYEPYWKKVIAIYADN